MQARKKLSILVAVILLLQILLPSLSNEQQVYAAISGPVIVSLSPADDANNVPTNAIFKATFDENIAFADLTKSATIYRSSSNSPVVSYAMNNSRVTISNNVLTINASNHDLALDTEYYMLIEAGAVKNVSNDALFAGISSASVWNFRTTDTVDTTRPAISSLGSGICSTSGTCNQTIAINATLQFVFTEPVYASSGNITLTSSQDNRSIPVTSTQVQGSGSSVITIKPDVALNPSTTYTLNIAATNFSDAAGNFFAGGSWKVVTDASPVQLVSMSPQSGATNVSATGNLQLTFDQNVQGNNTKYITIRKVSNNEVVFNRPAASPYISISGATVTINAASSLTYDTRYYVTIESGAISRSGNSSAIYSGIQSASEWTFTTGSSVDTTKPTVKTYSPEVNSKTTVANDKIILNFSEPVYANSGTIEIYEYNSNALYRSINVTSNRVTGGGTDTITIDPHSSRTGETAKTFTIATRYYVKISNTAFIDAAGNTYNGLTNKTYAFQVASTGAAPQIQSLSPVNGSATVPLQGTFKATFDKSVIVDQVNQEVTFIPAPNSTTSTVITGTMTVDPTNSRVVLITPSTSLVRDTNYYVNISNLSIMDVNGNYFVGILNQYQWAFKTIGGDVTPPIVTKAEVSGDTIRLVYNELLREDITPSSASFYVTVAGSPRNISKVTIEGNVAFIKLTSSVTSSQAVRISYTKPATGLIQDLSENQALGFANIIVSNGFTEDSPTIKSSSYSGTSVTLNFSSNLNKPSNLAYTQFSITVNNTVVTINSMTSNGSSLYFTLNQSIPSNASVVVNYSAGLYPITTTSSASINSFSHTVGTSTGTGSGSTSGKPQIRSITMSSNNLYLQYDEDLRASSKPGTYQYSVLVNNRVVSVTAVQMSNNMIVLTLSSTPSSTDTVTVTYSSTSSTVLDTDNNAADSFRNMAVSAGNTNDGEDNGTVVAQGAILKGDTLTINFSGRLDQNSIPVNNSFIVRIGDSTRLVSSLSVSGSQVIIKLSTSANVGDSAIVSYFEQSGDLKSAGGVKVNGFSNMSVANQTTLLDALSDDFGSALNGVLLKTSASSTSNDIAPSGATAQRYTLTTDKLMTAITTLANSNMTTANISFDVPTSENAAIVAFPLTALEVARQRGNYTLVVNYGGLSYSVPLSSIDLAKASTQSGGNAVSNYLRIAFEEGNTSATSALTTAINRSGATVIDVPFAYEVTVVNGTRSEDAVIKGNLTRTTKTTSSITSGNTTAVFYDEGISAISSVPTTFSTASGETTITFKRPGNSAYAIVRNTKQFSDTTSHWANAEITIMARKFIVEGHSSTAFNPSTNITRGEFATYIVKGLGLGVNPNAAKHFKDVNTSTVMGGYIGAAVDAGIVAGVSETSFAPNSNITRQDMALMMIRAASYAGLSTSLSSSADNILNGFSDKGQISSYAKSGVAIAVDLGIIGGTSATQLSPKKNATRAEGTLMIMRLLKKVNYIQY